MALTAWCGVFDRQPWRGLSQAKSWFPETVQDLVAGPLLVFEDRGAHELKGVPGSWRLAALLASR